MRRTRTLFASLTLSVACAPLGVAQAQTAASCAAVLRQAQDAQQAGDPTRAVELAQRVAAGRPSGTLHGFMAVQYYSLQRLPEALREGLACVRDLPSQQPRPRNWSWYHARCPLLVNELRGAGVTPAPEVVRETTAGPACDSGGDRARESTAPRPLAVGPWVAAGVGAGALVAGGVFLLLRDGADARASALCASPAAGVCDVGASMAARAEGDRYHGLFLGFTIAGALALTGGITWLVIDRARRASQVRERPRLSLQWTVVPTPEGVMAGVGGAL